MRRRSLAPRPDWQRSVERIGLTYHTAKDGSPYWDESAYWEFSAAEIDRLEAATAEIQRLALAAADAILARDLLARMHLPDATAAHIRETWLGRPPTLYGRLDLAFDGRQIKLLEYNADTPTGLVEAAVAQWYWLEERFPKADQFNSLHEKLVARWKHLEPEIVQPIYFGYDGGEEDAMTIAYLQDTAQQAGLKTDELFMRQVGWEHAANRFVDLQRQPIQTIFKLYPWEWLLQDDFGEHAIATMHTSRQKPAPGKVRWIEPIWKMLWSNKALLAILWELNPNHELLLPAYLDTPRSLQHYIRKPLVGREGAGVTLFRNWTQTGVAASANPLDVKAAGGHYVYQALAPMAQADGKTAVFGSWLINGEPAGMGVRESEGPITTNASRFVPHLFF